MRRTSRIYKNGTRSYKRRTYSRNRRKFNLRRLLRPLLVMVLLSGIGVGCYYIFTTPKLRITQVKVLGTQLVDSVDVKADVGHVVFDKNILLVSKKRVADVVQQDRPEIKEVRVGRILPQTIVVRIKERSAFACVAEDEGSSYWLVDEHGLPYHKVKTAPKSVPVIELVSELRTTLTAGKKSTSKALAGAMECIRDCRTAGYRAYKISVDQLGNLCLNIESDFCVKLGQPVDIPEKLEKLSEILAQPEIGRNALYIDVSCYTRPAHKPRQVDNTPDDQGT